MEENRETGFILIDEEPKKENEPLPELTPDEERQESEFREQYQDFSKDVPPYEKTKDPDIEFVESYSTETKKKKKMGAGKIALIICGILIASVLCGAGGAALSANILDSFGGGDSKESTTPGYSPEEATGSSLTVAEIVTKTADSVVEIRTEATATDSWMMQYVTEGAGSGVIIDAEQGYIMTNNHVIADASKVTVTLHNGNQYQAEIIGIDSTNDVAIIQIKPKEKLTAATFGDSDKLVVGELAVAIGNPLGELGGTVTAGIISALDRKINVDGVNMSLLQTDASINPGNSGGGLFNQYGQLIGLVVAKSSGSDVEGLGFAIPINTASKVSEQIIKKGGNIASEESGEAKIGVNIYDVQDEREAMQYGLNGTGVFIIQISHLNAQQAGFQIGDRFVKADGAHIKDSQDLMEVLADHAPGDKIKVVVEREGKEVTLTTELTSASEINEMPEMP